MRLSAYLSASRHGIFYFRFPVPVDWHPAQKRSHIKVSLSTREPREARILARILDLAGQSIFAQPKVRAIEGGLGVDTINGGNGNGDGLRDQFVFKSAPLGFPGRAFGVLVDLKCAEAPR